MLLRVWDWLMGLSPKHLFEIAFLTTIVGVFLLAGLRGVLAFIIFTVGMVLLTIAAGRGIREFFNYLDAPAPKKK